MTHEVIMPALGMAQSTGRLVRWLKAAGEAVSVGEPLFEVETDKTTMEVEAQETGFLAEVAVGEGQDVPVGQVIARIVAQAGGAVPTVAPSRVSPAPSPVAPVGAAPAASPVAPVPAPRPMPLPGGGRILASPKARRMAAEEGLDLALLVQAGHAQPFHVADLSRLRALAAPAPANPPAPAAEPGPTVAQLHVAARVSRSGSDAFLARMRDEAGITLDRRALWLAFSAAAWRGALPLTGALVVECQHPGDAPTRWLDPDRARLSAQPQTGDAPPGLILRDLTGTCLTALRTGAEALPVLTLAEDGDSLCLSLDARGADLSTDTAQAFLCDLARRLADPLPYLV